MGELDLKIGEDFQILTVSIDPKETTETIRKTKQKYVEQLLKDHPSVDEGWEFCTAKQPIITRLADVLGFRYTYDQASGEYYHPAMLAFVSPDGVITRYSLAVAFEPEDLKKALVEAGDGTVGSPVDQFILWCFSYDPTSNSYVPQAWKIMRLGGAGDRRLDAAHVWRPTGLAATAACRSNTTDEQPTTDEIPVESEPTSATWFGHCFELDIEPDLTRNMFAFLPPCFPSWATTPKTTLVPRIRIDVCPRQSIGCMGSSRGFASSSSSRSWRCLFYFAYKYHKPKGDKAESNVAHNTPLELAWSIVPSFFLVGMFVHWCQIVSRPPHRSRWCQRDRRAGVQVGLDDGLRWGHVPSRIAHFGRRADEVVDAIE